MADQLSRRTSIEKCARRISVSLPPELHHELAQIAKQKKVSLAWIIRDAAEQYVANKWPLLERKG